MSSYPRQQLMRMYEIGTGRHMLSRFAELERSQHFDRGQLQSLQRQKLHRLLTYAYQYIPYYRDIFDNYDFKVDDILKDYSLLGQLPILTRAKIEKHFDSLITTEPKRKSSLSKDNTSGSTASPLVFMTDKNFRDFFTAHLHLTWTGWQFGQPHAYIGGAFFEIMTMHSLRSRLMNWCFNRITTNANALTEAAMAEFAEQIRQHRSIFLYGFASSVYHFAQFVVENKIEGIKFKAVGTSADPLHPHIRDFIGQTFSCPVFDRYATRELGELASECSAQKGLHIGMESVYVEILNKAGEPCVPGEPGQMVVTNLNNYGMPFIRYGLSDMVTWCPDEPCSCGRHHAKLSIVEGREVDLFKGRDGRVVWGVVNPIWKMDNIKQFQCIQKDYDHIVLKVVMKSGTLHTDQQSEIVRSINQTLGGDISVDFEYLPQLPVDKSGKHRYQICEIAS